MPDLTFISSESWEVLAHEMLVEYPEDGTVQSGWWRHIRSNRSVWQYADSPLGAAEDAGWKPFHPPAYIEALTEYRGRLLRHFVFFFTATVLLFLRVSLCFLYLNYDTCSGVQIKEGDIGRTCVTLCGEQKCTQCSTANLNKREDKIRIYYNRPNLKVGSTNSTQGI